jgi:hypothetical protein
MVARAPPPSLAAYARAAAAAFSEVHDTISNLEEFFNRDELFPLKM